MSDLVALPDFRSSVVSKNGRGLVASSPESKTYSRSSSTNKPGISGNAAPSRESSAPRGARLTNPQPGYEIQTQAGAFVVLLQDEIDRARKVDSIDYANSQGWFDVAEELGEDFAMDQATSIMGHSDSTVIQLCARACKRAAEQKTGTLQTKNKPRFYRMTKSR